jgi:hypothetical protein
LVKSAWGCYETRKTVSHKFALETFGLTEILDIQSRATAGKTWVLNGGFNRRLIGTGSSRPLLIPIDEMSLFNHRCGSIPICFTLEEWHLLISAHSKLATNIVLIRHSVDLKITTADRRKNENVT